MKVGSITTDIIKNGLVFNMDAANRASTEPISTVTTSFNTINLTESGSFSDNGIFDSSTITPSFAFGGTDDFIECPNNSSISFGTSPHTLCAWANSSNLSNYRTIFSKRQGTTTDYNLSIGSSGEIYTYDGSATRQTGAQISINTWYYLVLVWLGPGSTSNNLFYVNGSLVSSSGAATTGNTNSHTLKIGKDGANANFWSGNIGPCHIYNRALSASEVLHNYNALKGRFGL